MNEVELDYDNVDIELDDVTETQEKGISAPGIEAVSSSFFNTLCWYFYDAADTYWNTVAASAYTTATLILFIKKYGYKYSTAMTINTAYLVISHLVSAILGPFLGALSDHYNTRKPAVLVVMLILSAISCSFIAFPNPWYMAVAFIIMNSSYQLGRMFYDTQIPFVLPSKRRTLLQGIGAGLSFVGSLVAIFILLGSNLIYGQPTALNDAFFQKPNFRDLLTVGSLPYSLLFGGIGTLVMGYPYIFHRETHGNSDSSRNPLVVLKQTAMGLAATIWQILRYPTALIYFLFWFFFTDSANTIQGFSGLTLMGMTGLTKLQSDLYLLAGIICAIIAGLAASWFIDRFGPKKLGFISLFTWVLSIIILTLAGLDIGNGRKIPSYLVYVNAINTGIGMGTIWTIGRQFLVEIAPPAQLAQYTGLAKICGRVSSMVSPVLFTGVLNFSQNQLGLSLNHSYRVAKIPLMLFLVIAIILLIFIRDHHKDYVNGLRAPYPSKKERKQQKKMAVKSEDESTASSVKGESSDIEIVSNENEIEEEEREQKKKERRDRRKNKADRSEMKDVDDGKQSSSSSSSSDSSSTSSDKLAAATAANA